jgi:hypothetical protein
MTRLEPCKCCCLPGHFSFCSLHPAAKKTFIKNFLSDAVNHLQNAFFHRLLEVIHVPQGQPLHRAFPSGKCMFIEFAISKGLLSEQRMSQAPLSLNFLYQPC